MDQETLETLVVLGPLAAFVLAALERFIPIMPSYLLFILFGTLLVEDLPSLVTVIGVSAVGSMLGSAVWFGIGTYLGPDRCRAFVGRYGKWVFLTVERYADLQQRFSSNAGKVVFIAQTIPTVRVLIALPAGVVRMPLLTYLGSTFLGCLVWNGSLITAGVYAQAASVSLPVLIAGIVGGILALELLCWLIFEMKKSQAKTLEAREN